MTMRLTDEQRELQALAREFAEAELRPNTAEWDEGRALPDDVFGKLATVESMLSDTRKRPSGELRVTTTVGFGSTWLTPRIARFIEQYPEIDLSIICEDRELDLGMREADMKPLTRRRLGCDR